MRHGDTVELKCQNKTITNDITWFGPQVVSPISKGHTIHWNSAKDRISITEQYNLRLSRIDNADIGKYKCILTAEKISYQLEFNLLLKSKYLLMSAKYIYHIPISCYFLHDRTFV